MIRNLKQFAVVTLGAAVTLSAATVMAEGYNNNAGANARTGVEVENKQQGYTNEAHEMKREAGQATDQFQRDANQLGNKIQRESNEMMNSAENAVDDMSDENAISEIDQLPKKGNVTLSGRVTEVDGNNNFIISDNQGETIDVKSDTPVQLSEGDHVTVRGEVKSELLGLGREIAASKVNVNSHSMN